MDPPNEAQSKNFNVKNYYRNSGQKLPDFIGKIEIKIVVRLDPDKMFRMHTHENIVVLM